MTTEIILYTSGITTTVSLIGFIYYRDKYKNLVISSSLIEKEYSQLLSEKEEKESTKRLAKFKTTGWYLTKDISNPKKTWDVYFELREVAVSVDEKKIKFEVLSVTSQGDGDLWQENNYIDWFNRKTGGGWLSESSPNLEWITTLSKSEARNLKLKQLGI
jgi:hypothetical protein